MADSPADCFFGNEFFAREALDGGVLGGVGLLNNGCLLVLEVGKREVGAFLSLFGYGEAVPDGVDVLALELEEFVLPLDELEFSFTPSSSQRAMASSVSKPIRLPLSSL